jgi:hypothetical protein
MPKFLMVFVTLWFAISPALTWAHQQPTDRFIDLDYYSPPDEPTAKMIEQVVTSLLTPPKWPTERPTLILTAGAMASGKSVVVELMKELGWIPPHFFTIDPDAIKERLPLYQLLKSQRDPSAGNQVHTQSMFVSDRLVEESLARGWSTIYMTSLRHTPSAARMIQWVRKWYPAYNIQILYVRSPLRFLSVRNRTRYEITQRLVPDSTLIDSIQQVDQSVRALEPLVDSVITVANEQTRTPRITYYSHHKPVPQIHFVNQPIAGPNIFIPPAHDPPLPRMLVGMDWDWTSAYPLLDGSFRWTDGLPEYFRVLHRLKIPFLYTSGGDLIRNENVLREVDLNEHGQLFELSLRVLSKMDLVPNAAGRPAKNLDSFSQIYSQTDMAHVDDQDNYLLNSAQNRSLIHLGATYVFVDDYDSWILSKGEQPLDKYDPPSKEDWALERNKLAFALGIILQGHVPRLVEI